MSRATHTPGEWSAGICEGDDVVTVVLESGRLVQIAQAVKSVPPGEAKANVALMAASPDLLAALSALHSMIAVQNIIQGLSEADQKAFKAAEAAIAKATGTTKKPKGQK